MNVKSCAGTKGMFGHVSELSRFLDLGVLRGQEATVMGGIVFVLSCGK